MRIEGEHPTLTVRHFFYDWDTEVPSSLHDRTARHTGCGRKARHRSGCRAVATTRRARRLRPGQPSSSFSSSVRRRQETGSSRVRPHRDGRGSGEQTRDRSLGAASRRGAHPRSRTTRRALLELLDRQPMVGDDPLRPPPVEPERPPGGGGCRRAGAGGIVRADPGIANWLDTAGHSNGAMILRCVRTETAPTPTTRVMAFDDVASALPAETSRVTSAERAAVLDRRRRAVHERFAL